MLPWRALHPGSCKKSVSLLIIAVRCTQPAVLNLRQTARPGGLDPLLTVPGQDGADSASNEHDGSNKVPDRLESNLNVNNTWTNCFMLHHLQYALLDVFSSVDDISKYEDGADDHVGDQGGVTEVLKVNIGVGVTEFQASCGKEKVVSVVSVSKIENCFLLFVLKLFFYQSYV